MCFPLVRDSCKNQMQLNSSEIIKNHHFCTFNTQQVEWHLVSTGEAIINKWVNESLVIRNYFSIVCTHTATKSRLDICAVLSCSVVSDSFRPCGLWPMRLCCPWNFPGKNTGVSCLFLLQAWYIKYINIPYDKCAHRVEKAPPLNAKAIGQGHYQLRVLWITECI